MFRITRLSPGVLVISEKPLQALVRLGIWIGIVVIFYLVTLGGIPVAGGAALGTDEWGLHEWLLLMFPVFLLPYVFSCIRALLGVGNLVFDGPSQSILRRGQLLAKFANIREMRLRAVNATCEEFCLTATLADGRVVTLLESKGTSGIDVVAEEISALVGVNLIRTA